MALGSKGRIRILRALAKKSLSLYMIVKETGLSSRNVKENLKILIDLGWIAEIKLSGSTEYKLNEENISVQFK